MLKSFFKSKNKANDQFNEDQYQLIKRLVSELPEGPGWAATFEKELSKATIAKLEEEGLQFERKTRTNGIPYYKISK